MNLISPSVTKSQIGLVWQPIAVFDPNLALSRWGTSDGIFEQAVVYKNRNRDTAWYSMLDHEWPATEKAYEKWLNPANFDDKGYQKTRLRELIQAERSGSSRSRISC